MADRTNNLLTDLRRCAEGASCHLCGHNDGETFMCMSNLAADAADVLQEYVGRCARYAEEAMELRDRYQWISVTERLPAEGERVLAATEGVFSGEAYLTCEGVWMRSYGVVWVSLVDRPVTHWMPLPDAPEVTCDG